LENLAVIGVRRVIAFGWCGSLQPWLKIGSLVIPRTAIREEGTSYHYLSPGERPEASPALVQTLFAGCEAAGSRAVEGVVWTTDALYREARAKVDAFRAQGVLGVEMETAAIFAVATCLGIESAVLLLVSDELASPEWQVGFLHEGFRSAHQAACGVAIAACRGY
jgi:uridine phosphorylase